MIISFECYCKAQWGQSLYIVGSAKKLGNWETGNAIPLKNRSSDRWKVEIEFETTSKIAFNYKYFIKDDNTGEIYWEFGNNRKVTRNVNRFKSICLIDYWQYRENEQNVWTKSAFSNVIFKRKPNSVKRYSLPAKISSIVEFQVVAPRVGVDYFVGVVGKGNVLGNWDEKNVMPLNDSAFPLWRGVIPAKGLTGDLEYKFVVVSKKTGKITTWENGSNRLLFLGEKPEKSLFQINGGLFSYPDNNLRKAGVSLPVFSIRTNESFGVGDFYDIKKVVDWAKKTGLKMIQVLPVNDTISTHSFLDSYPYKAISVFALHPLYLNIFKMGKLKNEKAKIEFAAIKTDLNSKEGVDYDLVVKLKIKYARLLYDEKGASFLKSRLFADYFKQNKKWLQPYAAFCFLRDKLGTSDFSEWGEYKSYHSNSVKSLFGSKSKSYTDIAFWYFIQFYLHKQLKDAGEYARGNGIVLKGDIPIGISRHSVDAWYEPCLYNFDGQAGAPPDDFSADGQNWGFPTYNWEQMKKDNYGWWRNRLKKMSEYFDAYRIDHILGFFRIWEIPIDAVQGVLGHFRPSLPMSKGELSKNGVLLDFDRMCKPYIRGHFLYDIFGAYTEDVIDKYLSEVESGVFELKNEFKTQKLIYDKFVGSNGPEGLPEKDKTIMWGLIRLVAEVLFLPAQGSENRFHPRISMHSTYSYNNLDEDLKGKLNTIYIHYYYQRHEHFWKEQALEKLPALVNATNMLVCGEDLGMIPATVPEVMRQFNILSLEIQRMPKNPENNFAHPSDAPYLSVCTTSTHDMSTIRGWWEEDRSKTQLFYNQQLGKFGEIPYFAEPWVCNEIITQHLFSPAMWVVFPIQDLLAIDEKLRWDDTHGERINEPANPRHYWKYRMHLSMEELMAANGFNKRLSSIIKDSGRDEDY